MRYYSSYEPITESPLVSIIIPVHNEEGSIGEVLRRVEQINQFRKEIIVVDDGSTDASLSIIKNFPVSIIRHEQNRGKGAAIRTGLFHCNGDVIVIQDADLEYLPEDIDNIIKPIIAGVADVVYGSRFLGTYKGMSISHRVGNWILSRTASFLYARHITDVMTGHKAFTCKAMHSLPDADGFDIEIEMTAKLLQRASIRYLEVPIKYAYRNEGHSKISSADGLKCLLKLIYLRIT
jgi:glycosyltransferase involved in cell wall biosynthesis